MKAKLKKDKKFYLLMTKALPIADFTETTFMITDRY